jgi:hypothetical protein
VNCRAIRRIRARHGRPLKAARLSVPLKLLTTLPRPLYEWLAMRVLKD